MTSPVIAARLVGLAVSLLLGLTATARGDWINLTGAESSPNIAEITVLEDRVRVALEIYPGDLATFRDLVPDEWLDPRPAGRPDLEERLARFSAEALRIEDGSGKILPADLVLADLRLRKDRYSPFAGMMNPFTRQQVPGPPEDKRVIYAELDYAFSGRPQQLVFTPPMDDSDRPAVTLGFIAYHKAVPIIDFRYLSGPTRLLIDWDDPWYTRFENRNLKRHHDSPAMSFLYVEPREVRHEILFRVRDLQDWVDLGLANRKQIEPGDRQRILEVARSFFAGRNPVQIDGQPASPVSSRAEFLEIALRGVQVVEDEAPLDVSTAIIGVILSYPVARLPERASVHWDLFNDRIGRIPATSVDEAGPLPGFIEPGSAVLEWQNFLVNHQDPQVRPVRLDDGRKIGIPLISTVLALVALALIGLAIRSTGWGRVLGLGGAAAIVLAAFLLQRTAVVNVSNPLAGLPESTAAAALLGEVLEQVNVAYLEKQSGPRRGALSVVVDDTVMTEVEAELDRALAIQVAGGGIARVTDIDAMALEEIAARDGGDGFQAIAEWTAQAAAGHWGHAHRRTLRFRALVELTDASGEWKLAGITVLDARQEP